MVEEIEGMVMYVLRKGRRQIGTAGLPTALALRPPMRR